MTTTPVRRPMNDSAHHDHSMVPTIKGEVGATVLGPDIVAIGLQNPGAALTDSGGMPNLKFFVRRRAQPSSTGRVGQGGHGARPAGRDHLGWVNMRLKAGSYRQLHWHREAQWAFMLAGSARITAIDPRGRNFIDDIGRGDLWNFRSGFPRWIQALEDCEFLLVE
jgi:oxalate decarboxylase